MAEESDDATKRDQHWLIARWLRRFLQETVAQIQALDQEVRHPTTDPASMNPEYMDFDSDHDEVKEE